MSKIADALKKAEEERFRIVSPMRERNTFSNNYTMGGKDAQIMVDLGFYCCCRDGVCCF